MSGFDFADRLRRGLGKGKVLPPEVIAQKLSPFDGNKDDAITLPELTQFFQANGIGGFVSSFLAKAIFTLCETAVGQSVTWIKVQPLSKLIADAMAQPPKSKPKRLVLTPEGMQGYEPMETLEESKARQARGAARPRPGASAVRGTPDPRTNTVGGTPRSGPPPRGRAAPRPGPRRPGPGAGPKR